MHPRWLRCSSLKYCPIFSVVAPGHRGASPASVRRRDFHHGLLGDGLLSRRLWYNAFTRMSKNGFALRYLAHTAAGVPRDLANTLVVSKLKPIRPTVLIYNCTWVCDARCEMCNNWKFGDRKSDMTLAQLEPVMRHPFWGAVENLNISGGEPTTRNDLPEMVEMFPRHLPRMRKIGINTTGLTPHRAIPMLTRIVKCCAETGLLLSVRVSLDGIGDIHNQVRQVKQGFDKACETIAAMQALAKHHSNFQFGLAATIFATNLQ